MPHRIKVRKIIIRAGERFGRLSIINEVEPYKKPNGQYVRKFLLQCDCGKFTEVVLDSLRKGVTKSCGCLQKEIVACLKKSHGMVHSPTYKTWEMMIQRCTNKNYDGFIDYGARGITICEEWRDFSEFFKDMGERPDGMSLDRVDVNGNYNKENCRWATTAQQGYNKRKHLRNTSGRTGVSKCKTGWRAYITLTGKQIYLYSGQDFFEACCARASAELKYFGFVKE